MFHHFFNTVIGHAFFITAVGHAYSLNTDIREPSSMYTSVLFNMELIEELESILEYYTQRNARVIAIYGDQPRLQLAYSVT